MMLDAARRGSAEAIWRSLVLFLFDAHNDGNASNGKLKKKSHARIVIDFIRRVDVPCR
jgi:hypothetical protein